MAKLSPLEYDRVRNDKAEELGIRVTTLDKEVIVRRATNVAQDSVAIVEELEPWPESVDGLKLANQIARTLADHVALPAGACTAVTLFAIGTYTMDSWRLWPKLLITSPEKRCGKSTLLEAIEATVHRPLLTASITASSLFRCIAAWTPTLLIDEADTFAKDNEELNGIINAGHTRRTATVIRSEKVGDVFEPRKFSVWCPQIIAGIKRQRDTLHDRSVHIQMRRKLPGETVNKLPYDLFERLRPLRQQAMRWALDNTGSLRASTPDVPHLGSDRAQDNWVPLFAIADAIGGNWPERTRKAYTTLTDTGEADDTAGPMLLHDIKSVFNEKHRDHIFSTELVRELIELEERPWCEWKHGKPMTKASLARLLRPFGVISGTVRIGTMTAKGYKRASFEDAWHRYLSDPPCQSVTTSQASQGAGLSQISKRHTTGRVTFSKSLKASQGAGCDVVTDENAPIETGRHLTPPEPWEDDL